MKPIIRVKNLSKQYKLGAQQKPYSTLRESLTQAVRTPFKSFGKSDKSEKNSFWALKDINFEVNPGEVVGIIGRNGAGKSTLLKILSRITEPTRGKIELYGRVGSLLEVGTGFHPELTGRENIFLNGAILGMKREEIAKKFDEIVNFAEVEQFIDTPVKHYSSGMYMRLAFAVAANLEPEVLIIDEVLAVGDADFQKKCLGKMKDVSEKQGRTVLFVSHNLSSIVDLCSKGIYLNNGSINDIGNVDDVMKSYIATKKTNRITFDKHLNYVEFRQDNDYIIIEAEYDTSRELDIPHLGFVIKNSLGMPITASNPTIDLVKNNIYKKKGRITVLMKEPKFLDGTYTVSIWFGDLKENLVSEYDCLSFEVVGMSEQKQLLPNLVGSVLPTCEWIFD